MAHKGGIEALDRTLSRTFGIVTSDKWNDCTTGLGLPADNTCCASRHMCLWGKACLTSSYLWPTDQVLLFRVNTRVYLKDDLKEEEFSNLLPEIGDRRLKEEDGEIHIPENLCEVIRDLKIIIDKIYMIWVIYTLKTRIGLKRELSLCLRMTLQQEFVIRYWINFWLRWEISVCGLHDEERGCGPHHCRVPSHFKSSRRVSHYNLCQKVEAPIMLLRNLISPKLCKLSPGCRCTLYILMSLKQPSLQDVV